MSRSKQNKSATKKVDGKYRHETREERRARLQQQEEARQVRYIELQLSHRRSFLEQPLIEMSHRFFMISSDGSFATIRQQCLKIVPYIVGVMVFFMIAFAIYVRSVPPKFIPKPVLQQPQFQGDTPDFSNMDTEPMVKQAIEEAMKKKSAAEAAAESEPVEEAAKAAAGSAAATEETIVEL